MALWVVCAAGWSTHPLMAVLLTNVVNVSHNKTTKYNNNQAIDSTRYQECGSILGLTLATY